MEICELVKVFILNATGTTPAVAQSAILVPPLEAGCALIGSQQSGFLLLFQPDLGHHAADRRAIDIEQFSNLSLTFRAQADNGFPLQYRFGLCHISASNLSCSRPPGPTYSPCLTAIFPHFHASHLPVFASCRAYLSICLVFRPMLPSVLSVRTSSARHWWFLRRGLRKHCSKSPSSH